MNPFEILESVRADYRTYVQTFQRFQNPVIHDWVSGLICGGKNNELLPCPIFVAVCISDGDVCINQLPGFG